MKIVLRGFAVIVTVLIGIVSNLLTAALSVSLIVSLSALTILLVVIEMVGSTGATDSGRNVGRSSIVPFQLPPDSVVVGRDADVEWIVKRATRRSSRSGPIIRNVTGPAGVGKTVLVVVAAHRMAKRFPGGTLFVDLASHVGHAREQGEVLADFLSALGVDGPAIPGSLSGRRSLYRTLTSVQRVLVVLDNAADAETVQGLLPSTGCVLVSSRGSLLGVPSSDVLRLGQLDDRAARSLLAHVCGPHRAFDDPTSIARIVSLCDHLPLALCVAAARLQTDPGLSARIFADALEERRLDVLSSGAVAVRASLASGYESLPDHVQRAFRYLSLQIDRVFPAWTLAVLLDQTSEDATDLLHALLMAQLVQPAGIDELGIARYGLHDLTALFAAERLADEDEPEQQQQARARLISGYLTLAGTADRQLQLHGAQHAPRTYAFAQAVDRSLERVVAEHPTTWFAIERRTLLAAIALAHRDEEWDLCIELTETLALYFERDPRWDDYIPASSCALDAAERAGRVQARAILLRDRLYTRRDRGDVTGAIADLQEAAEIFEHESDPYGQIDALANLAICERYIGQLPTARIHVEQCLQIYRQLDHVRGAGYMLREQAIHYWLQRDLESATESVTQAINTFRQVDDHRGEAWCLRTAGEIALAAAQPFEGFIATRATRSVVDDALLRTGGEQLRMAERIIPETADIRLSAWIQRDLAEFELARLRPRMATRHLGRALSIFEQIDHERGIAWCLFTRAGIYHARGHSVAAIADLQQSLRRMNLTNDQCGVAPVLSRLSHVYHDQGDNTAAAAAWSGAQGAFASLGYPNPPVL